MPRSGTGEAAEIRAPQPPPRASRRRAGQPDSSRLDPPTAQPGRPRHGAAAGAHRRGVSGAELKARQGGTSTYVTSGVRTSPDPWPVDPGSVDRDAVGALLVDSGAPLAAVAPHPRVPPEIPPAVPPAIPPAVPPAVDAFVPTAEETSYRDARRRGSRLVRRRREQEARRVLAGPPIGRVPALDGLRGLAVAAVVAYHFGVAGIHGGLLGVDVFFVLSGFLISSLLIDEWCLTGRVDLKAFWARRARRLLPAVLLVLVAVAIYAAFVADPDDRGRLRGDALSTFGYVANWHFAFSGQGYFARTASPSPLLHTWSLAVEEQFYLVWPLLAVFALRRGHRRLLAVAAGGALLSAGLMALLATHGVDDSRLYYGTDTRAQALLVGAVLAATRPRRLLTADRSRRLGAEIAGIGGFVALVLAIVLVDGQSPALYRGGFLAVAVAVAVVIRVGVGIPGSRLSVALSAAPLRRLGEVSYGVYLWHWPVEIVLDHDRTGLAGVTLLAARITVTMLFALVSYQFVEQPILRARRGRPAPAGGTSGRRRSRRAPRPRATWAPRLTALGAAAACVGAILLGTAGGQGNGQAADLTFASRGGALAAGAPKAATKVKPKPVATEPLGRTARILMVGDSVALTLGLPLGAIQSQYQTEVQLDVRLGCGIVAGVHNDKGQILPDPPGADCPAWPTTWRQHVQQDKPDVVAILVGRWEMTDRIHNGRWEHLGEPDYDAYVSQQLDKAITIAGSGGGRVVLMTNPCMKEPEQANGKPWPQDDPARLADFHKLLAEAAARHPSDTRVFDFADLVCPGGTFQKIVDGVQIRNSDGVHFTVAGAQAIGRTLLPALKKVAEELPHLGTTAGTTAPVTNPPTSPPPSTS